MKSIKIETYAQINKVSRATAINEINELIYYDYLKKIGAYRGADYILKKEKWNNPKKRRGYDSTFEGSDKIPPVEFYEGGLFY